MENNTGSRSSEFVCVMPSGSSGYRQIAGQNVDDLIQVDDVFDVAAVDGDLGHAVHDA